MLLGARLGSFGGGAAPLPYDAEVEYLRSNGSQYIDTGIVCSSDIGAYWKLKVNSYNDGCCGEYINISDKFYIDFWGSGVYFRYGTFSSSKITANFNASGVNEIEMRDGACYVNGVSSATSSDYSGVGRSSLKMYLFAQNNVNSPKNYLSADMYAHKLTKGGVLVADFIPVRVGSVGYMYDHVSGELFGNSGTGAFILGPDK